MAYLDYNGLQRFKANLDAQTNGLISAVYDNTKTYDVGDYVIYNNDLYRCTTAITTAEAWTAAHWTQVALADDVSELKSNIDGIYCYAQKTISASANGWRLNESNGLCSSNASYKMDKYAVTVGEILKIVSDDRFQFQNSASVPSTGTSNRVGNKTYGAGIFYLPVPSGATYLIISTPVSGSVAKCYDTTSAADKISELETTESIQFSTGYYVNYLTGEIAADEGYKYAKIDVHLFQGGNIKGVTASAPNTNYGIAFVDENGVYITGYRNTTAGVYKWSYDVTIPNKAAYLLLSLRIESESDYVAPEYPWEMVFRNAQKLQKESYEFITSEREINKKLNNAKHDKGNVGTPLTLAHFSDLHADKAALGRIVNDAANFEIDDIICTGDMVANTEGQITSWWDAKVMTCIGNHDTASYSSETGYDWTALSMANRDAYYIAPFESEWGITHTSGTSYYYKDYSTQKVRLIVMDAMLYTGTQSAEATAQTSWLDGLLSDAITNNLHVLIAIHAPHGGATAEDCSFSRYAQSAMPTYADCNTPQTVIDTVAAKITAGLKFIGYICGHTHQDNIWDAENDGKQLMYCVTCAAVADVNQWKNSDQYRGANYDAYNIVTIDTLNTLVKIVRGGGADIDDHMRTRKAICFNYSTGEKVGEVL